MRMARLPHSLILFLGLSSIQITGTSGDRSVVRTRYGTLEGTYNPITYLTQFFGVPYAESPLAGRRFEPPGPPKPWTDTRPAISHSAACWQFIRSEQPVGYSRYFGDFAKYLDWNLYRTHDESEDCLYLDIYIPGPVHPENEIPVMIWFHGGNFLTGSGVTYDASRLAITSNQIVVTVNYRLGLFGFMYWASGSANLGLRDQQLAARWVKENIGAFGGEPNHVTIFGQSAGGASVLYHMAMPESRGLFHRAIVQSGAFVLTHRNPYGIGEEPSDEKFWKVVNATGCYSSEKMIAFRCLKRMDAATLVEKTVSSGTFHVPVEDGATLPRGITKLFTAETSEGSSKKPHAVDLLVGWNTNDGWDEFGNRYTQQFLARDEVGREAFEQALWQRRGAEWLAAYYGITVNDGGCGELCAKYRKLLFAEYTPKVKSTVAFKKAYLNALTEPVHGATAYQMALVYARTQGPDGGRVFLYNFDHHPWFQRGAIREFVRGTHGSELPYTFGWISTQSNKGLQTVPAQEEQLSALMNRAWADFADRANTSSISTLYPDLKPVWEPAASDGARANCFVWQMGVNASRLSRDNERRLRFWTNLQARLVGTDENGRTSAAAQTLSYVALVIFSAASILAHPVW